MGTADLSVGGKSWTHCPFNNAGTGWWGRNLRNIDWAEKPDLEDRCAWDLTYDKAVPALRKLGVTGAVAYGTPNRELILTKTNEFNEFLADAQNESKGFIKAGGSIDPHDANVNKRLEYIISSLEIKALKFWPILQWFRSNDFNLMHQIYNRCEDAGVTIVFHQGPIGIEPFHVAGPVIPELAHELTRSIYDEPLWLDEVAYKYPQMKIVIAHAAASGPGNLLAAAGICQIKPNVYIDLSRVTDVWEWSEELPKIPEQYRDRAMYDALIESGIGDWPKQYCLQNLKTLLMWARPDKLMLGSDFAGQSPAWVAKVVEGLVPSSKIRKAILEDNARKVFDM